LVASNGQVQGSGDYYREDILKKFACNNWRLKNDSDIGGMF
jgi:hypothetical protein